MAPKRNLEDPPAASSMEEEDSNAETVDEEEEVQNDAVDNGQEDEEEEEEDDEEEEDEEEEGVDVNAKTKPNVPSPESESASDDDAGSETESDAMTHSPTASDFTVKPIVSKPNPINDSSASKPTKKSAAATVTPAKRSAAARDPNPKDSKKKKGSGSGDDDDTNKKGRLWGEDGEIAILEGMIEFKAKKGSDPSSNMSEFHEFMRKRLKADVSKSQLMDKVRRLKKKYFHPNAAEAPEFVKEHERKLVALSNKIWGVEANGGGIDGGKSSKKKPRKSVKADDSDSPVLALPVSYVPAEQSAEKSAERTAQKKKVERKVEMNVANGVVKAESDEAFWSKYPHLRDSLLPGKWSGLETVLMQGMPSIGSAKAKELDDRWRKLQVLEMELVAKRLALEQEQTKLILDAMKSRKD